jgi:hypothetical protein
MFIFVYKTNGKLLMILKNIYKSLNIYIFYIYNKGRNN